MCNNCCNSDLELLNDVFTEMKENGDNLITVLQKAQDIYGYLPTDVLYKIAEETGASPAKVLGVATFYTQFRLQKVGKYLILLCKGTACHVNGADSIEKAIYDELHIKDSQTTDDGLFTLKTVACLGCCSLSPVMMINEETYGSLTPQKTAEILRKLREESTNENSGR